MNLFKKLFGSKEKTQEASEQTKDPENTRLHFLLNNYAGNPSTENYRAVLKELENGTSYLLLPSVNERKESGGWTSAQQRQTLVLTTVFDVDGLKVLGAFSDEANMVAWSKRPTEYTAMRSQDVFDLCKTQGIGRIVINSDQKTMFVVERNRANITSRTIEEETKVLVGTPKKPIPEPILNKLRENFAKVGPIEEAYQFAQQMGGEYSLVLGIRMNVESDNARAALHDAINNALQDEKLQFAFDIMVLNENWLQTVRGIENSLFYKR